MKYGTNSQMHILNTELISIIYTVESKEQQVEECYFTNIRTLSFINFIIRDYLLPIQTSVYCSNKTNFSIFII